MTNCIDIYCFSSFSCFQLTLSYWFLMEKGRIWIPLCFSCCHKHKCSKQCKRSRFFSAWPKIYPIRPFFKTVFTLLFSSVSVNKMYTHVNLLHAKHNTAKKIFICNVYQPILTIVAATDSQKCLFPHSSHFRHISQVLLEIF